MNRQILRLAVPNILSNLSVPLLGIADTALMGHQADPVFLGAIALGGVLFNVIYWGFGFLRMGTTGMTAQAFGAENPTESARILARALCVALVGALAVLLLHGPIGALGFRLLAGEGTVKQLASEYFRVRIWAAPATLSLYALHGWFLGMQNARYPLVLTVVTNGANVAFNFLFVLGLGMKAEGVALGTVCAQYLGLGIGVLLFLGRYRDYLSRIDMAGIFERGALARFFTTNRDIFLRTMFLVFVFSYFTSAGAALGEQTLAVNQILLQYFYLMSYGVDGFAYAAESLVGRFTGAKNQSGLRSLLGRILLWGLGLGGGFALIWLLAGAPLLRVFTDQPDLIADARQYLPWLAAVSLAGAGAFIWDGVYIGATATRPMRDTMVIAVVVFLGTWFLARSSLGNHGLWMAMTAFMVMRSATLTALVRRHILKPA